MSNPIVRTVVDSITVNWALGKTELSAHFNCKDAGGNNLSGLGSTYNSNQYVGRAQTTLLAFIIGRAQQLIIDCDEWAGESEEIEVRHINIARYGPVPGLHGQGIAAHFVRAGDVFECALLFETRPGPDGKMMTRFNQKHDVTDADLLQRVHALIETAFDATEKLIHEINMARPIRRKEGRQQWHS